MTSSQIPYATEQGIFFAEQGIFSTEQGIQSMDRGIMDRKRRFLAHLFRSLPDAICSPLNFADEENEMADEILTARATARRSGGRAMRHGVGVS